MVNVNEQYLVLMMVHLQVVWVTATLPYLILFILLIRNATLEGSLEGIKFYMIPDATKLLDYQVSNCEICLRESVPCNCS